MSPGPSPPLTARRTDVDNSGHESCEAVLKRGRRNRHEPQEQSPDRQEKKPPRSAWIAGGVLILIGINFIIRNVTGLVFDTWWALFILIPALGSLVTAWQMYERNDRRFTAASRGPLVGGIILLAVTAILLFKLDWGIVWPFFIILVGLGVLFSAFERKK